MVTRTFNPQLLSLHNALITQSCNPAKIKLRKKSSQMAQITVHFLNINNKRASD